MPFHGSDLYPHSITPHHPLEPYLGRLPYYLYLRGATYAHSATTVTPVAENSKDPYNNAVIYKTYHFL